LYPNSMHYTDVYDQHGLLSNRSVFAHGIHLSNEEIDRFSKSDAAIAFCPSSNFFLGSGVFDLKRAEQENIRVGIGTDVGAGTSFSILKTLQDAYKSQQLQGNRLSPLKSLYLATLGGARALNLDDKIGNFKAGKEADFIILDLTQPAVLNMRTRNSNRLTDKLFATCIFGDDRTVKYSYIMVKRETMKKPNAADQLL